MEPNHEKRPPNPVEKPMKDRLDAQYPRERPGPEPRFYRGVYNGLIATLLVIVVIGFAWLLFR